MNDQNTQKNIQDKVFERIRTGHVHSRPKLYFIARLVATVVVAVVTLAVSAFVVSFILFSIHESGEQFLLGFGLQGLQTFVQIFPWIFVLFDAALLFLLEWLVRGFSFSYRISLFELSAVVILCSIALAVGINLTPLHRNLLDRADNGALPLVGEWYESIHDSHADRGVFRGTVASIQGNVIVLTHDDNDRDSDDGTHTVNLLPPYPPLQVGDHVYVFGSEINGVIQARGVEKFTDNQ